MDISFEKVTRALEDPAYVAVGFGILGFQRAQVRRREVQRHVARLVNSLGQLVGEISNDLAEQLPTEASDLLRAATDLAHDLPREVGESAKEVVALGRLVLKSRRADGDRPSP